MGGTVLDEGPDSLNMLPEGDGLLLLRGKVANAPRDRGVLEPLCGGLCSDVILNGLQVGIGDWTSAHEIKS